MDDGWRLETFYRDVRIVVELDKHPHPRAKRNGKMMIYFAASTSPGVWHVSASVQGMEVLIERAYQLIDRRMRLYPQEWRCE